MYFWDPLPVHSMSNIIGSTHILRSILVILSSSNTKEYKEPFFIPTIVGAERISFVFGGARKENKFTHYPKHMAYPFSDSVDGGNGAVALEVGEKSSNLMKSADNITGPKLRLSVGNTGHVYFHDRFLNYKSNRNIM